MLKKLTFSANISFFCGVGLGLYALASVYLSSAGGACPVDSKRSIMIVAVLLLVISVIIQTIVDSLQKKIKKEKEMLDQARTPAEEIEKLKIEEKESPLE